MEIRIKGRDYEISSEVQSYLDTRLNAIEKHADAGAKPVRCEVEIGKASGRSQQGKIWYTEIHIDRNGEQYYASAEAESITEAIDTVKDEIIRQLTNEKEVERTRVRKGGATLKDMLRES